MNRYMDKGLFVVFGAIFGLIMMNHAGLSIMSDAQADVVSNVISPNRIAANRISANKLATNKLGLNKLGVNKLGANKLGVNKLASNDLDGAVDVRALAAHPLVKADQ